MAVIWREDLKIEGKVYKDRKVYKSLGFTVTREGEEKAEKLDKLIKAKVKKIKRDVRKRNLLKLKKRKGVLDLWYLVGKHLQFIDETDLISQEERKFIWEAVWYHVEKIFPELIPGKQKKRRGTARDHFRICYELGRFPREVVEKGGIWSEWMEFFDAKTISEDGRILIWVLKKVGSEKLGKYWLKGFYRSLKKHFSGKITTVFTEKELNKKLESTWRESQA